MTSGQRIIVLFIPSKIALEYNCRVQTPLIYNVKYVPNIVSSCGREVNKPAEVGGVGGGVLGGKGHP